MDVGKIHSYSSNNKLFTEVDKKDIVSKEKGKDVSSDKITEDAKVSYQAIIDKKIVSQNVSSSASVSNTSLQSNSSSDPNDAAISKKEITSEQPASSALYDSPSSPAFPGVSPIGTRVEFAIEKELNLVVTTVRDLDTEKIIRQLPPEYTISRMKMLKSYYNQMTHANLGNKVDEVVK